MERAEGREGWGVGGSEWQGEVEEREGGGEREIERGREGVRENGVFRG